MNEIAAWISPSNHPELLPQEVHLWRIVLDSGALPEDKRNLLSQEEIGRADRFHFERDRRRFTQARAAMRNILAQYLKLHPTSLMFLYGEQGKPELSAQWNPMELQFNLSHSHDLALLAVTQKHIVGVDVERINRDFSSLEIAERFFSNDEVQDLLNVSPEQRAEAFFRCWTRKEAYIKARGNGLSIPLDSFSIRLGPDAKPALIRVDETPDELERWNIYDIAVDSGYKAALVVEKETRTLRQWRWNESQGIRVF